MRRSELLIPASTALAEATHRATVSANPLCCGQSAKIAASTTAPRVWPVRRAVPNMPLAAPLRCSGAEVTMV